MELALKMSGVGPGDEVLTSPFSCMASNSPIATLGATPVWVDLAPGSTCINIDEVEKQITKRTKALILYHLAGYANLAESAVALCKKYGIKLIEDCNNSYFTKIGNKNVGTYGDFSVYSFYPNRLINTIDGGAISVRSVEDYIFAKKMTKYGLDPQTFRDSTGEINPQSDIPHIWRTIGMNNLSSALGYSQLSSVDARIQRIKINVSLLYEYFSERDDVHIVKSSDNSNNVNWVFFIQVNKRNELLKTLKLNGIFASKLHQLNSCYTGFKSKEMAIPNAVRLQNTLIALPCGWWLDENQIHHMIDVINDSLGLVESGRWIDD